MKKILLLSALLIPLNALAADTLGKTPVYTKNKNDVQAQITDQGGSTLLNVQSNNSAPGAGGGAQVLVGLVNSALPTYTAGNIAMPSIDTGGRTYVATDAATNLRVNLTQVLGATLSATNPVFNQLTDGTAVYVAAKTGQFPAVLGQTTMAGSLSVAIASNQSAIPVILNPPSGAAFNRATPVNIASAATTAIVCKGSLAVSTPLKVYKVVATGMAQARCTVQYNDNGTLTKFGDVETSPNTPTAIFDCNAGFCGLTTSATATTQQIELSCNNFDSTAQDFGCAVQYCQSATGC